MTLMKRILIYTRQILININQFINIMTEPVRIRKSLASILHKDQRKSYFYCLKMLGILPPPPNSGFEKWTFYTPPVHKSAGGTQGTVLPKKIYTPKCLHDVLIASHATSCEHHGFYFAHYHRHLMILTELFLNFAHQVLKGGLNYLKGIYPQKKFGFLYGVTIQGHWNDVFKIYQSLRTPNEVSNHYWNPTDYLNDLQMKIPEELQKKISSDPIDALFQAVNHSYPWEIKTDRRWYNTPQQYDFDQLSKMFQTTPVNYTENQTKFINGQLDPRLYPQIYQEDTLDSQGRPVKKFLYELMGHQEKKVLNRNFTEFDKQKKIYTLNNITDHESLANYGSKTKNLQYISRQDQIKYNITEDTALDYNDLIPHFQFAKSLFNQDLKAFFQDWKKGIQNSHDYLHDLFRFIMNDGTFSVTSLIFWPYHSWIDAQLEMKLRREMASSTQAYTYLRSTLDDKFIAFPEDVNSVLNSVFYQLSDNATMDSLASWNLSGEPDNPIKEDTAGFYPIVQWVTPQIRQFPKTSPSIQAISPSFCSRDLILTKNNIRLSHQLNDIYRNNYAQYYKSRFYFLPNITTFNYNYNYLVGSLSDEPKELLNLDASNIPKYLKDMELYWFPQNQPKIQALHQTIQKSFGKKKELELLYVSEKESESIRKLFTSGLQMFASYPTNAQNGVNFVYLKLDNIFADFSKKQLKQKELNRLEKFVKYGIFVQKIYIFGKSNFAEVCSKCQYKKAVFFDLDQNLRLKVPKIWQYLHLSTLAQTLYDSSNPKARIPSIYDKVSLAQNKTFSDYQLISGAEEIFVDVVSKIKEKETKFIRLDAESYSISQDIREQVVSKKYLSFESDFDFYKIFDVNNKNDHIYFDRYVYKYLKGWVSVGNRQVKFEIKIPNYQRLIRLTLQINLIDDKLNVIVKDSDYHLKIFYYEKAFTA